MTSDGRLCFKRYTEGWNDHDSDAIALDGVDVVAVSDDRLTSITGYFDRRAFTEQLGLTFPAVVGQLPTLAVGAVKHGLS